MFECVITDKNLGLDPIEMYNPKIRIGARGIVRNKDGKIAIFNKQAKNEYKLPGGGVEDGEDIKETFIREVMEEAGCEVNNIIQIGIVEERKSFTNFKQISYIFSCDVVNDTKELRLTEKEAEEQARLLWMEPHEALKIMKENYNNLKGSKYDDLYRTKFMSLRDRRVLEKYLGE